MGQDCGLHLNFVDTNASGKQNFDPRASLPNRPTKVSLFA